MGSAKDYYAAKVTIEKVESIPCDVVGQSILVDSEGNHNKNFDAPWDMDWILGEVKKVVKRNKSLKQARFTVYNPEEPDQLADIYFEQFDGDIFTGNTEVLISDFVNKWNRISPEKVVLINEDGSLRYTYKDLNEISMKLSKAMINAGIKKGDRVGLWIKNRPEWVMMQVAVSRIGAVLVPMNAHEKLTYIEHILKNCEINMLVTAPGVYGNENQDILGQICPDFKLTEKLPFLKNIITIGGELAGDMILWDDFLDSGYSISDEEINKLRYDLDMDTVVHIIQTSGTTGLPKGVMLSQLGIVETARRTSRRMNISYDDIFCVQSPLFHTFGCVTGSVASLMYGCTMVILHLAKAQTILTRVQDFKCTVISGVPTVFHALVEEAKANKYEISSLRTGIVAGALCPEKLAKEIYLVLGMKDFTMQYGLTEASPALTASYYNDPLEKKISNVGCVLDGVEIKIVDLNSNEEISVPDIKGEIYARGNNLMKGYYKQPEETAKAIDEDGWLHTGDIGSWDDFGYLKIDSRLKDIIIKGGENISPIEVETFLTNNPKIYEANVVGIPDDVNGEEVVAFIKLVEGEEMTYDELKKSSMGKIATNKIPKYVQFVKEFPLSDMGKVLKRTLREQAIEKFSKK